MSKVTIEDISRHTGLSRGTVSRALNDRPDISEQTKQRVLEACRQLNYVPSLAARALATGRNFAVAVLVHELHSAYGLAVMRGVLIEAARARYAVHAVELGDSAPAAAERVGKLATERVDGIIVAGPLDSALVSELSAALANRPLAACWAIPDIPCDQLLPDQVESGRLAARLALRKNNRSVAYLHADGSPAATDRLQGFQEICRQQGIDPATVTRAVPRDAEDMEALRSGLDGIQAIVATDDFVAIDAMLLCMRSGRLPGQDVAVIGQGNEPVSARIHPSLSTIDFGGEEAGRRAMDVVLQRLGEQRMDSAQVTYVPPVAVARQTTRLLD